MRVAALLVASLSMVGCRAPHEARTDVRTGETMNLTAPDPTGPARAANGAAAKANDAAQAEQQAIDDLGAQ